MKIQAIIPTAGIGSRFRTHVPKPLVELNGKPIFLYALEIFESSPLVHSVIVVANQTHLKDFQSIIRKSSLNKVSKIVPGGERRADSVFAGLQALDKDTEGVLVHDGVRPFVTAHLIESVVKELKQHQAVIAAVPVKPTIKKIDLKKMTVQKTIPREDVWEVQTPQGFQKKVIMDAHKNFTKGTPTDDAMMVEEMGVPVKVVMGDYRNLKITTPEDLTLAEALLSTLSSRGA